MQEFWDRLFLCKHTRGQHVSLVRSAKTLVPLGRSVYHSTRLSADARPSAKSHGETRPHVRLFRRGSTCRFATAGMRWTGHCPFRVFFRSVEFFSHVGGQHRANRVRRLRRRHAPSHRVRQESSTQSNSRMANRRRRTPTGQKCPKHYRLPNGCFRWCHHGRDSERLHVDCYRHRQSQ